MRKAVKGIVVALFVILLGASAADAQVNVNISVFPELVPVPDYPVYYAPSVRGNYFFYDGLYWVFNVNDGYWYSSSWYNGPWVYVQPAFVPQPILVVPYRYYRIRPAYWNGWAFDAPPRWGLHWGPAWERRRVGWDHWDRRGYIIAPLPLYQKDYPRGHYPTLEQQVIIHKEHYKYVVKDVVVREHHNEIIHQQSLGGAKANGKAERIVTSRRGDGQGSSDGQVHEDRSVRREKLQGQGQGQQKQNFQDQGPQHQDKSPRERKVQQEGNGQHDKGQREKKGHEQAL